MHFNHILQLSIPSTIFQHTARPKVVSSILPGPGLWVLLFDYSQNYDPSVPKLDHIIIKR